MTRRNKLEGDSMKTTRWKHFILQQKEKMWSTTSRKQSWRRQDEISLVDNKKKKMWSTSRSKHSWRRQVEIRLVDNKKNICSWRQGESGHEDDKMKKFSWQQKEKNKKQTFMVTTSRNRNTFSRQYEENL